MMDVVGIVRTDLVIRRLTSCTVKYFPCGLAFKLIANVIVYFIVGSNIYKENLNLIKMNVSIWLIDRLCSLHLLCHTI